MIAIVNISKSYSKVQSQLYALKINHQELCRFRHIPTDGLAVCLEKAAAAYRKKCPDRIDPGLFAYILDNP